MQPDTIELIPLVQIDAEALNRDRVGANPVAMQELQNSILAHGLRMPVEVFELESPSGKAGYALISGFRRLAVFRDLAVTMGFANFAEIPAIIRHPESIAAAYAAMVEENSVRAEISPYERGRIAVVAVEKGIFATIDAAIDGLYPAANATKRSRIRALAELSLELDGHLKAAEWLSLRQSLRIGAALRMNFGDLIRTALDQSKDHTPERQWEIIEPILAEAEHEHRNPPPVRRPGHPRRILHPRPAVINLWITLPPVDNFAGFSRNNGPGCARPVEKVLATTQKI